MRRILFGILLSSTLHAEEVDLFSRLDDLGLTPEEQEVAAKSFAFNREQQRVAEEVELIGELEELQALEPEDPVRRAAAIRAQQTPSYIRFVDDRSRYSEAAYPVGGLSLEIIGWDAPVETDSLGELDLEGLGGIRHGLIRGESQFIAPFSAELSGDLSYRSDLIVPRRFALDSYRRAVGASDEVFLADYCGVLHSAADQSVAGLQLASDQPAAMGPYYFNEYGFIDPELESAGTNGRFCFFGLNDGPLLISVYEGTQLVGLGVITLTAGRVAIDPLIVDREVDLPLKGQVLPTAHEQLADEASFANRRMPVQETNVIPLGEGEPMVQRGDVFELETRPLRDRTFLYQDGYLLEPSIVSDQNRTMVFLPRGTMEDLATYAQVAFRNDLGRIYVEAAAQAEVTIFDSDGEVVKDAWSYQAMPVRRYAAWNLEPGVYTVRIRSNGANVIETIPVYSQTTSIVADVVESGAK